MNQLLPRPTETISSPVAVEMIAPELQEHAPVTPSGEWVSLDREPLFEQNGVKALIGFEISPEAGEAQQYWLVDVSEKDYEREEGGKVDKVNYLVVNNDYFGESTDGQDPMTDNKNFKSIQDAGGYASHGGRVEIGGAYDNTRFGTKGNDDVLAIDLRGGSGSDKPRVSVMGGKKDLSESNNIEMNYALDRKNPVEFVKLARGEREKLTPDQKQERREARREAGQGFMQRIRERLSARHNNYEDYYSDTKHDVLDENLAVDNALLDEIDEQIGFDMSNGEKIKAHLDQALASETDGFMDAFKEAAEKKRGQRIIGAIAATAVMAAGAVIQQKYGTRPPDGSWLQSDMNNGDVIGYSIVGAGALVQGDFLHKLGGVLPKRLAERMKALRPDTPNFELKNTDETSLIQSVSEVHRRHLHDLVQKSHDYNPKVGEN